MGAPAKASKHLFSPLKPKRNFEEVAHQIKKLIFSGKLKAGERLPAEREMAELFNSSRNTVREAYRTLEESGFIEMKTGNNGGAWVRKLDGRMVTRSLTDLVQVGNISLENITKARLTLELASLDEALLHIDLADVEELERCLDKVADEMDGGDEGAATADKSGLYTFHVKLAEKSRNHVYAYLVASLVQITLQFLSQHVSHMTGERNHLEDHRSILSALKTKDRETARMLLKEHILSMGGEISRHVTT